MILLRDVAFCVQCTSKSSGIKTSLYRLVSWWAMEPTFLQLKGQPVMFASSILSTDEAEDLRGHTISL